MYNNREDAGQQLAKQLVDYKGQANTIVIGLPRGGVVVANEIAKILNLPLDIIVPRKIGSPGNEEFAIGAIAEDGKPMLDQEILNTYNIDQSFIDKTVTAEQKEAQRRLHIYRDNKPPLNLESMTAILVDDGIATGHTMLAAIASAKTKGARNIVVAIPVAAPDSLSTIKPLVNKIVCLQPTLPFGAVGASYINFYQTSDEEVMQLLQKAN